MILIRDQLRSQDRGRSEPNTTILGAPQS